jgi:hypothetical protein
LRETVDQTISAARRIDVDEALPRGEIARMWQDMRELAAAEHVSLLEMSSAITLHSLNKIASVGQGALSSVRVAGQLADAHLLEHYRAALGDIHRQGYYQTLAQVSGPYIEGVWRNFAADKVTVTEDLASGRMLKRGAKAIGKWFRGKDRKEDDDGIEPNADDADSSR